MVAMSRRLQDNIHLLHVLSKAKPTLRKAILTSADKELIYCLLECIDNLLSGNIKLSPSQFKNLRKSKTIIRNILVHKGGWTKKRKLFVQKGGFLPQLLIPVLALAGNLLANAAFE